MNCFYGLILLLIPLTLAYPRSYSNDFDRFLEKYFKERSQLNEGFLDRRQVMYPLSPMQQYQPQMQPTCLPHVWTCGPGLPPCCAGLMCYDGNAKRGRQCVARG
jgi:hypothetical protein